MKKVPGTLLAAALTACVARTIPPHFVVPEDARNPIVIRYAGAPVAEIVDAIAKICSDVPIPTAQVVPDRGYVETRWIDVATLRPDPQTETYPARERIVLYAFQVKETGEKAGTIELSGWYQPTRPSRAAGGRSARYDRLLPTDHPGYQVALELELRLRRELVRRHVHVAGHTATRGK